MLTGTMKAMRSFNDSKCKYADFDRFVVFSFPRTISDIRTDGVIKFVQENFSDRSLVFTGYHQGANYAAKITSQMRENLILKEIK